MKLRKSINEDWTASASMHTPLSSAITAYNQLKNSDPESATRYNPAYNAAAYADAILAAVDSINEIEDETQMAQKMSQYANLVKGVDSSIKQNYSQLTSLITGSKGSLPSQLSESKSLSEDLDDYLDVIGQLTEVARYISASDKNAKGNQIISQMLYIIIDTIILSSSKDNSSDEVASALMLDRFNDAISYLSGVNSDSPDSGLPAGATFAQVDSSDDDDDDSNIDSGETSDPDDDILDDDDDGESNYKRISESMLNEIDFKKSSTSGNGDGTLYSWEHNRKSYAEKYLKDPKALKAYKNGIDSIVDLVMKAFPKAYEKFNNKVKLTPGDIWAVSRDVLSKDAFEKNASIANKLKDLRQVGSPAGLRDTEIWVGIDEPANYHMGSQDDVYVLMITKGKVVSMFILTPEARDNIYGEAD